MSRTIRKKILTNKDRGWVLRNRDDYRYDFGYVTAPLLDPNSKQAKKQLAQFHRDQRTYKEPGPAWFRHVTVERPQRRFATVQLHRIVQGEEFELMLEAKGSLLWWL
jgi:hypothetical protein